MKFQIERCTRGEKCPYQHVKDEATKKKAEEFFQKKNEDPLQKKNMPFHCRFFGTEAGCLKGNKCDFQHANPEQNTEANASQKDDPEAKALDACHSQRLSLENSPSEEAFVLDFDCISHDELSIWEKSGQLKKCKRSTFRGSGNDVENC